MTPPLAFTADKVVLETAKGPRTVPVMGFVGGFAVHQAVEAAGGWTVTHVATGKKIWTTEELHGAIRVATYLDTAKIIPEDKMGAEQWRANLSEPDRSRLIEDLSMLAPRVTE